MKFASFTLNGEAAFGIAGEQGVTDGRRLCGAKYADLRAVIAAGALEELADACSGRRADAALDDIGFLPVIPNPAKIFCVGVNYEAHRLETGREKRAYPTIFTRFADTLIGHGQPMIRPQASRSLDYECELAVVIGRGGRHIDKADAMEHIAGYSCFNDGSVRDWQRHTTQFTPGKNFPATGGFGPFLVTPDEIGNVNDLDIQTRLNGAVMQHSNTSQMIFDTAALIAYVSTFTALAPGDVIATGTPGGVGFKRDPAVFMHPGDEVVVEIENVGLLRNPVAGE